MTHSEQTDPLPSPAPRSIVPQIAETTGQMRLNPSLKSDPRGLIKNSLSPKASVPSRISGPPREPVDLASAKSSGTLIGRVRGTPSAQSDFSAEFNASVPPSEVPSQLQARSLTRLPWVVVASAGALLFACVAFVGYRTAARRTAATAVVSPTGPEPGTRAALVSPVPSPTPSPAPSLAEPSAPAVAESAVVPDLPAEGHAAATDIARSRRVRRGPPGATAGPVGPARANHSATPYEPPGL